MYVDYVTYRDGGLADEMRDYRKVEHLPGWVIWWWKNSTVAIPSDRIENITTCEED